MSDSRLGVVVTAVLVGLAVVAGGCSDGDDADSTDVTEAYDRLEELGLAILDARSATSTDELRDTVGPVFEARPVDRALPRARSPQRLPGGAGQLTPATSTRSASAGLEPAACG
jgi:hypothetical protein